MRLRFAPSPTGFLHIGNARTAIINNLIAKKLKADFVLRIEDTDFERSSRESELSIMDDLTWLGVEWNEGPNIDKGNGPYRQSERFDIYKNYTNRLLAEGKAYHCYCTEDELDAMREKASADKETFQYPQKCLNLSDEEKTEFERQGRKPVVRFKIPRNQGVEFDDLIRGIVTFSSENIGGDFIIVRSDGVPVYNYLVVIDDELMKITNVIRGEDHLSNTPKQILIAEALGIKPPVYAHLPLVLGNDKKKLSKRHGITSVNLYRQEGYLPEALVNYIAMLGWASKSEKEVMPLQEIIDEIDLNNLAKSAAVFDFQKLKWMNGIYIREYNIDDIIKLFTPFLQGICSIGDYDYEWFKKVIELVRSRCELLSDVKKYIATYTSDIPEISEEALKVLALPEGQTILKTAHKLFQDGISENDLYVNFTDIIKSITALGGKKLFMPCRVILTFEIHGPDLKDMIPLIGTDKCRKRVEYLYSNFIKQE